MRFKMIVHAFGGRDESEETIPVELTLGDVDFPADLLLDNDELSDFISSVEEYEGFTLDSGGDDINFELDVASWECDDSEIVMKAGSAFQKIATFLITQLREQRKDDL